MPNQVWHDSHPEPDSGSNHIIHAQLFLSSCIKTKEEGSSVQAYYCHTCAAKRGYLNVPTSSPLNSNYQLEKYMKHTVPNPSYSVQSVFPSASTQAYQNYLLSTLLLARYRKMTLVARTSSGLLVNILGLNTKMV